MKILGINLYKNTQTPIIKEIQTNPIRYNTPDYPNDSLNFEGTPRVDKGMVRFYEFNLERLPLTVKNFLESFTDKFKFTPLEAQREAFSALKQAKNIEDVKAAFPQEKLFMNLKSLKDTKASIGLLAIYREFKDLYEEGILKNGQDLTVYLLAKIFLDAKTLDEINEDIENDLNDDIKDEFKHRYNDTDYIHRSTLKSLGIELPDNAYLNSLKFTREGYSDEFGANVSQALLKRWNELTDEQKFEILSKRCEGRDNWWNSLSYDEKLELAAGVDPENDLYRQYKRYVKAGKKEIQEGNFNQELEKPTKKIKIGKSNLKDQDLFNLWFRKNMEKFYSHLSEADKDVVHIKRVRQLAVRWQEMSPEKRTELINKMREGREPLKYAMIDAWNHSPELIKELSKFLTAQQILKPVDLLYETKEFSEFQSKVMTEFWASHRDLAEKFGETLHNSIVKVETSIKNGQFQDLKKEIERDQKYRKKALLREKLAEEQKLNKTTESDVAVQDYRKEFKDAYRLYMNKESILPDTYVDEMTDCMLQDFGQDVIEKITEVYKANKDIPEELVNIFEKGGTMQNYERVVRLQRALEAAIANELCEKGANSIFFSLDADSLIGIYRHRMHEKLPRKNYPDPKRIQRLFNEYRKDLTDEEVNVIVNRYFLVKNNEYDTPENNEMLEEYVRSFGKSALILFSEKSAFSDDIKSQFNEKFLKLMPGKIKEISIPIYSSIEDIKEEKAIQRIKSQIANRYNFMPLDFLDTYTQEVASTIRLFKRSDVPEKETYSIENFEEYACKKQVAANGTSMYVKIPKAMPLRNSKIKMLAAEQALADELFRVTGEESVYGLEVEELLNIFEIFSMSKLNDREILDKDGTVKYVAKTKPNRNLIYMNYRKYLNDLKNSADDIFDGNYIKNPEELLFTLNQIEDNEVRDNYIKQRIEAYLE